MDKKFVDFSRCSFLSIISMILQIFVGTLRGDSQTFSAVNVSGSLLSTADKNVSYTVASKTICALATSKESWGHLMCYSDNVCNIYDLLVASNYRESDTIVQQCYTDQPQKWCKVDDILIGPGATEEINCKQILCNDGNPETLSGPRGVDFKFVSSQIGCLYIQEALLPWDQARANCQSYGGDLFATQDLTHIQAYLADHYPTGLSGDASLGPWVGIQYGNWLDGNQVEPSLWDATQPNEPENESCGLLLAPGGFRLHDHFCIALLYSVCQFM